MLMSFVLVYEQCWESSLHKTCLVAGLLHERSRKAFIYLENRSCIIECLLKMRIVLRIVLVLRAYRSTILMNTSQVTVTFSLELPIDQLQGRSRGHSSVWPKGLWGGLDWQMCLGQNILAETGVACRPGILGSFCSYTKPFTYSDTYNLFPRVSL